MLNAGIGLTAAVTIFSYAINLELSRAYVVIALPSLTVFDMLARFALRKRLVRRRMHGKCMHSVVAVGHELAVADLVTELGRDGYHGLNVVGACVVQPGELDRLLASRSMAGWMTSRPQSRGSMRDTAVPPAPRWRVTGPRPA